MSEPNPITRLNAALEGRYRIESELGEGGMATVYLADDLKHERKVALKVLKPELAAVVGAERFLAEIKTTANLQHPHILPLFDSGEADTYLFYVMPYVEGETLRDRLDREHQLPVDEAVRIATSVANALDYAHRHDVIHRDIKPANILMHDGQPVISDFGIALAVGAAQQGRLTETGLSVGTPHYMSPEQATGDQTVGVATDIYALGAVLYETLVGEPPYTGSTAQAILGKIIQAEPVSATKARRSVPANVDAAIRKSLEKVSADRFAGAHDFAEALSDPGFRHGVELVAGMAAVRGQWTPLAMGLGALALLFGGVAGWGLLRPDPPMPVTIVSVDFPEDQEVSGQGTFDISQDGSLLVYQGPSVSGEGTQLWARRWAVRDATPIRDTEGAALPAVSPNGEEVAFEAGNSIRVVSVQGGPSRTVAPDSAQCCVRWSPDGAWLYFSNPANGLSRVPAAGGPVEVVTQPDAEAGETRHLWIDVLPDGQAAVYQSIGGAGSRVMAVSVESGEVMELTPGRFPRYSQGYLLFTDPNAPTLFAQPFDPETLELSGAATPVAEGLRALSNGWNYFAVSQTGSLVYSPGRGGEQYGTTLVSVSSDGTWTVLEELEDRAEWPRFSPDGLRVAYGLTGGNDGESDLWVLDLARGAQTRVTFGGNNKYYPTWTPDGTRLVHSDGSGAENRLLTTPADGSGGSVVMLELGPRRYATSWTADGLTLAYHVGPAGTPTNSRDLWTLTVDGAEPSLSPFVQTPFSERGALFSPNGRWVAYVSDKSGRDDIYLRPFPGPGVEVTISVGGGQEPVWAPSGNELYYRRDQELMVVSVTETGSSLSVGTPRPLFDDPFMRDVGGAAGGVSNYDIAPDGETFVMVEDPVTVQGRPAELYLVLNWLEELRQRVPN
jgi:Tol biopolymer transport system component